MSEFIFFYESYFFFSKKAFKPTKLIKSDFQPRKSNNSIWVCRQVDEDMGEMTKVKVFGTGDNYS